MMDRRDLPLVSVLGVSIAIYAFFLFSAVLFPTFDARFVQKESGLLENFQVAVVTAALAVAVVAINLEAFAFLPWARAWLALVIGGLFYIVGEEISWGQQYFHWATEGWFAIHNDQGETNFHNTSSWFDQKPRAVILVGMIVGGIVHPLVQRWRGRGLFNQPWWWAPTIVALPSAVLALIANVPKEIDQLHILSIRLSAGRPSEVQELFIYVFMLT